MFHQLQHAELREVTAYGVLVAGNISFLTTILVILNTPGLFLVAHFVVELVVDVKMISIYVRNTSQRHTIIYNVHRGRTLSQSRASVASHFSRQGVLKVRFPVPVFFWCKFRLKFRINIRLSSFLLT